MTTLLYYVRLFTVGILLFVYEPGKKMRLFVGKQPMYEMFLGQPCAIGGRGLSPTVLPGEGVHFRVWAMGSQKNHWGGHRTFFSKCAEIAEKIFSHSHKQISVSYAFGFLSVNVWF